MRDLDLFGNSIEPVTGPLEEDLRAHDEQAFSSRLNRLKYVNKILPDLLFMTNMEIYYLLLESKATFINGQFAATILLSQAVIEQWLYGHLAGKYNLSPKAGMKDILDCLRKNDLFHPYLIDKIDRLRRIRNPFVHNRSYDDPDRIEHRALRASKVPDELIERDAKDALELMYHVVLTP
jgi:hypothetical protein